jgi:GDPmannose 4,6-dehydratase
LKKALIFGVTGQDGSYLAEYLVSLGYEVHGVVRRSSNFNTRRIDHLIRPDVKTPGSLALHFGDVSDYSRVATLISELRPHEIYNLAAQSHVKVSFDQPIYTAEVDAIGVANLLEAIRMFSPDSKFYQASSSEMFGSTPPPQSEETPFHPRSTYGVSKVFAYWQTRHYREAYGIFASNGILFNHESPRRGETFVTRKITLAAARISMGFQDKLFLGNLAAVRDWGYAPEYVVGMWRMLQHSSPDDFVLATGHKMSVEEFLGHAFGAADLDWRKYVELSDAYLRPTEVDSLIGDYSKAERQLGWVPAVFPETLARIMVESDLEYTKFGMNKAYVDTPSFNV